MKPLRKKRFLKIVSCVLMVIILLISSVIPAFAAQNYDGGVGVGGGGSSSVATGTYSVHDDFADKDYDKNIMGLRFSVYNIHTGKSYGSIDVYRSAYDRISGIINHKKASVKYNHKELENNWTKIGLYWTTDHTFFYDSDLSKLTGVEIALPETTSKIEAWQWNYNNTKVILQCIGNGAPKSIDEFKSGDRLMIEPIYPISVAGSTYVLTVAEIAVLGAKTYGTGSISAANVQSSWRYIANQTNRYFPGSLMTTSGESGIYPATSQPNSCISFLQILQGGYGLSAVWNTYEDVLHTDTISHWAFGFKNGEGHNGNKTAFRLINTTFSFKVGSTFKLDQTQKTNIPNGFYLQPGFGTSAISGTWGTYNFPTTVTQKNGAMGFEYYYHPYAYKITYNLNGGTNSAANPSTYTVLYGVTLEAPTKAGYAFDGWYIGSTKVTGINPGANASFTNAADMYTKLASRTIGDIELTAKWHSTSDIVYTVKHWLQNDDGNPMLENDENFTLKEIETFSGAAGEEITPPVKKYTGYTSPTKQTVVIEADGSTVVNYYYTRDEHPFIEAVDRWFTLKDAQAGKITLEELMKTAEAIDSDIGDKTDFAKGEGEFTIMDYGDEDFKLFSTSGSVTVTYKAVDKANNEAYKTVTVHIVSTYHQESDKGSDLSGNSVIKFIRFINSKFFKDDEGNYVPENDGGLVANSIWIVNDDYNETLSEALSNKKNKETGEWDFVYLSISFSKDKVTKVKEYIDIHGLGNFNEDNSLTKFIELYN